MRLCIYPTVVYFIFGCIILHDSCCARIAWRECFAHSLVSIFQSQNYAKVVNRVDMYNVHTYKLTADYTCADFWIQYLVMHAKDRPTSDWHWHTNVGISHRIRLWDRRRVADVGPLSAFHRWSTCWVAGCMPEQHQPEHLWTDRTWHGSAWWRPHPKGATVPDVQPNDQAVVDPVLEQTLQPWDASISAAVCVNI